MTVGYVGAFALLHPRIGDPVVALSIVPIITAGWLTSTRGGIVAGIAYVALDIALMQTIGDQDGFRVQQTPRILVAIATGAAAGWARSITRQLRAALDEKEVLVKEVHHRVKNNLQVISSLLNLQARTVDSQVLREVFDESQRRIQAIALVHDQLYRSRDLTAIDCDDYLRSLVSGVMTASDAAERGVTATIEASHVNLTVETAIPCGLIVNELVTNALKHAFPNKHAGTIAVTMKSTGDRMQLRVADDGIGLPASVDPRNTTTLGLELVYTLAEQLDATVDVSAVGGTTFTFSFAG
jgi:two-component sensor histidine kinase